MLKKLAQNLVGYGVFYWDQFIGFTRVFGGMLLYILY